MFGGIFAFLGQVLAFVRDLFAAHQAKKNDKDLQHDLRVQAGEKAITKGDADALSVQLNDSLSWLQNHRPPDRQ